jgi:hypothetical protein
VQTSAAQTHAGFRVAPLHRTGRCLWPGALSARTPHTSTRSSYLRAVKQPAAPQPYPRLSSSPAKRGALPAAACDELEGAGRQLLAGSRHTHHDALPPAAVRALECRTHDLQYRGGTWGSTLAVHPELVSACLVRVPWCMQVQVQARAGVRQHALSPSGWPKDTTTTAALPAFPPPGTGTGHSQTFSLSHLHLPNALKGVVDAPARGAHLNQHLRSQPASRTRVSERASSSLVDNYPVNNGPALSSTHTRARSTRHTTAKAH